MANEKPRLVEVRGESFRATEKNPHSDRLACLPAKFAEANTSRLLCQRASPTVATMASAETIPPGLVVVFYDGSCGLCERSVRWLLDHDPGQQLRFAPLQGSTAAQFRQAGIAVPEALESVAVAIRSGDSVRLLVRAQAFLELCRILAFQPWWVRMLSRLPPSLLDFGYGLVAKIRYRLFGKSSACPWRNPHEADRFLP